MFNPQNVPPGGVCLSSFVLVRKGGSILVGKMARPEVWIERFFVGENFAPEYAGSNKYLLPARHLAWYESPLAAAADILQEQLKSRTTKKSIKLLDVQSHLRGDPNSKEQPAHWDICFVYETKLPANFAGQLKQLPWWRDLKFVPLSSLSASDFTRGHGDVLEEAGLLAHG